MAKKPKSNKATAGPYLAAAFICERALVEPDSVASAIRIVDVVNLPPEVLPERGTIIGLQLAMLIILKAGDFRGDADLRLNLINPSGAKEETTKWPLKFTDPPEGGQNLRTPVLALKWDTPGLYWFELTLGSTVLTRIPLRINIVHPSPAEEPKPVSKRQRRV